MLKPIDKRRLKQFKEDLSLLEIRFPIAVLSQRMDVNKGNLSSYLNGKKPLSDQFLKKFYRVFSNDLKMLKPKETTPKTKKPTSPKPPLGPNWDILSALRDINIRLGKVESICLQLLKQKRPNK